jgi:hypothetical protein
MFSRLRAFLLLPVVAIAVLVPLYGAPRSTVVTQAEWARMLLRALKMDDVLPSTTQASQAFATLSWKNSLSYPADHYLRATGMQWTGKQLQPIGGEGEVSYPLAIARRGEYKLRLSMTGDGKSPVTAEIAQAADATPVKTFTVTPGSVNGWLDAGSISLPPGAYTTSLRMPPGTSLDRMEVAPPCLDSIEPPGGWNASAQTQVGDVAVTTVEALAKESELPPAEAPIEIDGSALQTTEGARVMSAQQGGAEALALKAGPSGLKAIVFVEIPETGLYSVSSFGVEGGGQSWLGDSCRRAVVCATQSTAGSGAQWHAVMTSTLTAGKHFMEVTLGPGASIGRVRFERKKTTPADYVDTLKRLGFDAGPAGAVARDKAVDAMKFIESHRNALVAQTCGDVATTTVAVNIETAGVPGGGQPGPPVGGVTPPGNPGQAPPPVGGPPAIPPQNPASPVLP